MRSLSGLMVLLLLVLGSIFYLQLTLSKKCATLATDINYLRERSSIEDLRQIGHLRPPFISNPSLCSQKHSDYSISDTNRVQNLIESFQNPSNCSNLRYFILDSTSNGGFGSGMHLRSLMFTIALNIGRILIDANHDIRWQFASTHCRMQAPECNFLPLTHCTPTADDPRPFLRVLNYFGFPHQERVIIFPDFSNRSQEWWHAQLVRYLMRPNRFTLSEVIAPAREAIFPSGAVPETLASSFIRRGDRESGREGKIYSIDDYFNALERSARMYNVTSVFLMSDSQKAIEDSIAAYSNRYRIYYLPWKGRSQVGWEWDFVVKGKRPELDHLYLSQLGTITISELFIAAQALVFVGTIRSNQCRLLQELRLAYGNTCTEYISLD
jgi:hypothetical protein